MTGKRNLCLCFFWDLVFSFCCAREKQNIQRTLTVGNFIPPRVKTTSQKLCCDKRHQSISNLILWMAIPQGSRIYVWSLSSKQILALWSSSSLALISIHTAPPPTEASADHSFGDLFNCEQMKPLKQKKSKLEVKKRTLAMQTKNKKKATL
ncbi:uncharacterized protein K452DRAFT_42587 [Aplosporella prunicola CBS 121167]|uniref:Secreted protein n=1 Tax=Aplosporella prunicola CBS 121167 TaxID=1176127 RepID=A0A6A6BCE4_9PEZI|nr:uncharacterized protein K452DRAFT_42587 [Aplosporella prunicola CBS 121167]KAF2140904.1 hypothetical protein K452DRAFT_42587 [Aplosporella prunicola CBS 121167]